MLMFIQTQSVITVWLVSTPWEDCFMQVEFNRGWDLSKRYLISAIDRHAPLKENKFEGKRVPCLTREIRQLTNTRYFHLCKFEQTNLDAHWIQYKNLRNTMTKKDSFYRNQVTFGSNSKMLPFQEHDQYKQNAHRQWLPYFKHVG